ncbi:hypothetical protein [Leptospira levettii]|uniref:hypothetical protein n=1 Tax=Leptospira levettii TaxID=2023178 RepID=UPI000C29C2C7|nr:hypothetical protein [Leptospira levettii]PJZ87611.1 hypothetical protein CH368_16000 [Leptospira levettii]
MSKEFNFSLSGIARIFQIGKSGKKIRSQSDSIEFLNSDETDFSPIKIADPTEEDHAVTYRWVKENLLLNWGPPVGTITDLRSILPTDRRDKQIRYVEDEKGYWQFDFESILPEPDPTDSKRVLVPNDITPPSPGRWIWTRGRTERHTDLLGLEIGDDHPQYQLRSEKESENGYAGLDGARGLKIQNNDGSSWITSILRSIATETREWLLPNKNGTLATDDNFIGTDGLTPGAKGLVPQPVTADIEKFLSAKGTWEENRLLYNTDIKTADYTAKQYERVLVDTSSPVIITLPPSPTDGVMLAILDVSNNASTNPIVLEPGSLAINDGLAGEEWTLDMDGIYVSLSFSAVANKWFFNEIPGTFVPLTPIGVLNSPVGNETTSAPSVNWVSTRLATKQNSLPITNALGQLSVESELRVSKPTDYNLSPAGDETLDCASFSNFRKTGGTATITLSNLGEGQEVSLLIESTGSAYVITWDGGTFKWVGSSIPTPTPSASKLDLYEFKRIGGIIIAEAKLNIG